uniref:Alpha-type protein kinase domain-containing protein n=1 Tax=Eutreptiella gymnastica TaxID=73025 RepID=A0A7S1HS98_9EUGL|mmetsp:Transcript_101360/g.175048  ORF Transcript_101360/g.175048 Transcript_101360/m.175048 type:complete len:361 (+) Transcript_101360:42-1124(+)
MHICHQRCPAPKSASSQSNEAYKLVVINALTDHNSLRNTMLDGTDLGGGLVLPSAGIQDVGGTLPPFKSRRQASPAQGEPVIKHVFNYEENRWTSHQTRVQLEEKPFAEGRMRVCFRLKDLNMPVGAQDHVAKMMKREDSVPNYFLDCELQVMAGALAKKFNALQVNNFKLSFVDTFIFEFTDRVHPSTKGPVFMSVETYHGSDFYHFVVGDSACHWCDTGRDANGIYSTAAAFCHFTAYISGGTLVVTDLQGFPQGDQVAFTDPRIGSNKYDIWGGGPKRMRSFFRNHKCNDLCQQLMLPGLNRLGIAGQKLLEPPDTQILDRIVNSTANTLQDLVGKKALAGLLPVYLSKTPKSIERS